MANPTRAELANEALVLTGNLAGDLTQMKLWVDRAYDEIQCLRHFRQTYASPVTFSTVVGTPGYALPADFRSIYTVRDNTSNTRLAQASPQRYDLFSQTQQSISTHYVVLGESLILWPKPSAIVTIQVRYRKLLTFASDATPHGLPLQWSDAIVMAAAARGLDYRNEHDRAMACRRVVRYYDENLPSLVDEDLIDRDDAVDQLGNAK